MVVSRAPARATRYWWIRHAACATATGLILPPDAAPDLAGGTDIALAALRRRLPEPALHVTSSLRRAYMTAAKLSHVPAQRLAALDEQNFGAWIGSTHDALWQSGDAGYRAFWQDAANSAPPEGESFSQQCARVAAAITQLGAMHEGIDLVLVVHAGTIRAALAVALDLAPAQALRFAIDPLSLTRLDCLAGAWRVGQVNGRA